MVADVIVNVHAADGARLEFDARDPNFGAIYLPERSDAGVRTAGAPRCLRI